MDKLISVGFKFSPTIVLTLRSTAMDTFSIFPSVLDALVTNLGMADRVIEIERENQVFPFGEL